jgi:hypothetical protein
MAAAPCAKFAIVNFIKENAISVVCSRWLEQQGKVCLNYTN